MASAKLIGLDIGSTSVRAVQTGGGRSGPAVTGCAEERLPAGAVQGGVVHDEKAVTAALKRLRGGTRFRGRDVVLGVTNPQIFIREMSLPSLPAKEMRRSLPVQVHDALPLPVERSLLDFIPLDPPAADHTVRGLLIAAPKDAVLTTINAIERSGLHVSRVDLASLALLRAVSRLDTQVEGIVDIGAHATSVVVHADGRPLIVRTIPRGGAEITKLVMERFGCPEEEAEALKCRVGLRTDTDAQIAEAIWEAVRPFINEIISSFAYLMAGDKTMRVTRLLMSGGGSLLPGLLEALKAQLNVPVVLADPLLRLRGARRGRDRNLERFLPSAAISIGLALGAA